MVYAYRSEKREDESIIYAEKCTIQDLGIRMYCPNLSCDAHIYLCNLSNPDIKPYFRATKNNHPHVKDCSYANLSFNSKDYYEPAFDFDQATKNVMKPPSSKPSDNVIKPSLSHRKLPPHTIKQIYELAISHDINYNYNGIKMWQLLADKRSSHIYSKGLFRKCLVESYFAGYNTYKNYIRMKYYIDSNNFHYMRLVFNDNKVFSKTINIILEAKPSPIIVWGDWKAIDYYFKTTIYNTSQIYVPT